MAVPLVPLSRRSGTRLDAARLDFEMDRRALTARKLAEAAGIHEVSLSRARHGHPVTQATLRRITRALLETPLCMGADLLLAEPAKSKRSAPADSTEGSG